MTAPRTVSVVVPHFNDLVGLDLCLSGLRRQTYPESAYEIIVADNASPQGPAAVSAVIGDRARLVVVPEKGAGPARNGGAALAGGEILAFIDSDCRPDPDWLTQGVEALGACDFVGGRVEVLVDDVHRMTASEAFERVFAFDNEAYVTRKGFSVSANLFCPRALFDAVGGFAVGVSEDVDWCHRALKAGYRIGYAPRAVIGHPARRTWTDLLKKWRRLNVESYGLFLARPHGRLLWLARSLLLPVSAVAHTPAVFASPGLATAGQRVSALGILYRLRLWRFADALRLAFQRRD